MWAWVLTEPTPLKGVSDGTWQKENAEPTFAFTELFTSVVMFFVLHFQHLQIQFALTNQFGFENNFQGLINDGKGAGSSFFYCAGPDLW